MNEEAIPVAPAAVTGVEGFSSPSQDESPRPARHAFRVGGLRLLVPLGVLCEVVDVPPIARLPNTARWLLGIANLRGAVMPVFNLAHALGLASALPADARVLVIGEGESAVGMVIDGLPTLERFAPEQRVGAPEGLPAMLQGCVTDCFAGDGDHWIEFTHERLFSVLAAQVTMG